MLRRSMRRFAGRSGVILVAKFGPFRPTSWPYTYKIISISIDGKTKGVDKWTDGPKWLQLSEDGWEIKVFVKGDWLDLTRPSLDVRRGLVLYVEPPHRNGTPPRAILVQNTVDSPE